MGDEVGDPPRLTDGHVSIHGDQQRHPDGHRLRGGRQRPAGRLDVRHHPTIGLRHPVRPVLYRLRATVASNRSSSLITVQSYLRERMSYLRKKNFIRRVKNSGCGRKTLPTQQAVTVY